MSDERPAGAIVPAVPDPVVIGEVRDPQWDLDFVASAELPEAD